MQLRGYVGWPLLPIGDRCERCLGHVGGTAGEDEEGSGLAPLGSSPTVGW